ncbi:hypothetical protein [Desulfosporosinus youngiae]|uniref:Uncharacterized protein n=1 Tax=Desulfosporosinus youngiae DSM 17734 TaxID=768710 RepID=H5XZV6_9FIRM|nr:hypothetical protein [Desulfosporosinus youngiae]EHQ88275.1 hypothetical protein DesyoDRAFT_1105 [Desulfosporosinus youngiae DSM 17734]EHQ92152.1 hypothetical protein DesyoDRAFT_5221 [Desulfosporosinus youngiae DSM 17734]
MDTTYYYLTDLNQVGKIEDFVPYLHDKEKGWIVDNDNLLMDRVMGYDGDGIGSSDMVFRADEISGAKAMRLIENG